jgi:hypothetical protein
MASTISTPTLDQLGNYPPKIAEQLIAVAAAAKVDVEALQASMGAEDFKSSVKAATTGALVATRASNVLTADANGAMGAQDGVTMVVGDRLLVKDQGTGADNGIYTVTSLGSGGTPYVLTRATDADSSAEVTPGMVVFVEQGTTLAETQWILDVNAAITLNTTALTFVQFRGLATAAPAAVAYAAVVGTGTTVARADHVHALPAQAGTSRTARGVVYSNVADLGVFTVASDDGITYVEGNRVLLTMQTTVAQNGIYVVGVVGGGTAALTRATDMAAATVQPNGLVVEISEGTHYEGSSWKAMSTQAGGWTVGTHDPVFYPRIWKQTITLAAGTYKIGFGSTANPDEPLFLWSTTKSMVNITRDTAGGTLTGTVMYACPVTTRVAGLPGVANIVINSVIEAGTIQNQDTSTLSVLVTNW